MREHPNSPPEDPIQHPKRDGVIHGKPPATALFFRWCVLFVTVPYLILTNLARQGWTDTDDGNRYTCYNQSDPWTCEDYDHLRGHYGANLDNDLQCLGYDRNQRPDEVAREPGKTDRIRASLKFTHISSLQDDTQIFEPEFWLLLMWTDPRVRFPAECGNTSEFFRIDSHHFEKNMWLPPVDLAGVIEIQTRRAFTSDTGAFLDKSGEVGLWKRYISRLNCPMDFSLFPFDIQICHFKLYLGTDIGTGNETIVWDDSIETDPDDITLPNWDVNLRRNDKLRFTNVLGAPANGAAVTFTLTRLWTFHLMQTFLPSCMIMIASVLSVFVPAHLVPGRMGLCITAFLSMISLINGTRDDWPPTTHLKAIDYWSGICYFLVFTALAEYCIVLYLMRHHDILQVHPERHLPLPIHVRSQFSTETVPKKGRCNGEVHIAEQIESFARFLLPASLIACNLVFWTTILLARRDEDES